MNTHQEVDRRSLAMVKEIVAKIDADPGQAGLQRAREVCRRWVERGNQPAVEWMAILKGTWDDIRAVLLDENYEGQRLRQSDPFCGILSPQERWAVYRRFSSRV